MNKSGLLPLGRWAPLLSHTMSPTAALCNMLLHYEHTYCTFLLLRPTNTILLPQIIMRAPKQPTNGFCSLLCSEQSETFFNKTIYFWLFIFFLFFIKFKSAVGTGSKWSFDKATFFTAFSSKQIKWWGYKVDTQWWLKVWVSYKTSLDGCFMASCRVTSLTDTWKGKWPECVTDMLREIIVMWKFAKSMTGALPLCREDPSSWQVWHINTLFKGWLLHRCAWDKSL